MTTIDEKIANNRYNPDAAHAHIKVDYAICETDPEKPCLYVCCVKNYTLVDGKLQFVWMPCIECGACRVVCKWGAIQWEYPRGGYGVALRYG